MVKGDKYYQVYKGDSFFIKEEIVEEGMYGSDYYHTRFKDKANAEKFILDVQEKSYTQFQIKHACIHVGINYTIADKLYLFLQKRAIK